MSKKKVGATKSTVPVTTWTATFPKLSLKYGLADSIENLHEEDMLLFTVPSVLNAKESAACIAFAEERGFKPAEKGPPKKGCAFRNNGRLQVEGNEGHHIAQSLWEVVKDCFEGFEVDAKIAVGLQDNVRFYKYEKGQKFEKHVDESHKAQLDGQPTTSEFTLLLYLNGEEENSPTGAHPTSTFWLTTAQLSGGNELQPHQRG
eukprot:TRINITY_DN62270_c0_g1_i2.p1 TRINITY_DN62270_c0_g1~~TRINITY_DN62270_c0_g1_i2.p1  ORF type:complete len:203 (-),score=23.87 TRINITY_DN62270_c0_g1_i2:272-880(-)